MIHAKISEELWLALPWQTQKPKMLCFEPCTSMPLRWWLQASLFICPIKPLSTVSHRSVWLLEPTHVNTELAKSELPLALNSDPGYSGTLIECIYLLRYLQIRYNMTVWLKTGTNSYLLVVAASGFGFLACTCASCALLRQTGFVLIYPEQSLLWTHEANLYWVHRWPIHLLLACSILVHHMEIFPDSSS